MSPIQMLLKRGLPNVRKRLLHGAQDERGAVAVIFAIALVLLAPLVVGVVDIYMSSSQRSRLQDALDAAALYTARSNATSADAVSETGQKALLANLSAADQARLISSSFALQDSTIVASAELAPQSIASGFWHRGAMKVNTNVVRSSINLEVALVLDITGSMSGSKIADLKVAAGELVDLVVQDEQTPYYSKLAIVPYSNSVNVGDYAASVRGDIPAGMPITGATKAGYYVTVNSANHGFAVDDYVAFADVGGMHQLNNKSFKVTSKDANSFTIYVGGGTYSSYTSGGSAYCTTSGCEFYRFQNANGGGNYSTHRISTCASERIGTHKYNDVAPSTSTVGRVYPPSSGNNCPSAPIAPLSTDKTALKATIDSLATDGSTAGHIGLAWGWYMVSPNFGYLWPDTSSRPAAYGTDELLKVVVLMTDGAFNTAYCNGVNAKNSGFGSSSARINCNATNGSAFTQAQALCTNMKAQGIVIYTVGFDVGSDWQASSLMSQCATDAEHTYMPSSGEDLRNAFRAIAQDINSLRLSH